LLILDSRGGRFTAGAEGAGVAREAGAVAVVLKLTVPPKDEATPLTNP